MASNNAVTGSEALINLQNNLNSLSGELQRIYDLMYNQMKGLGNSWKDSKYQDFVVGFKPQIDKCKEISESYKKWSTTTLQRTIDAVLEAEKADVSGKRIHGGASHVGAASGSGTPNEEAVSNRTSHFGHTSDVNVSDDVRESDAINADKRSGRASSLSDSSGVASDPQLRRSSDRTSHLGRFSGDIRESTNNTPLDNSNSTTGNVKEEGLLGSMKQGAKTFMRKADNLYVSKFGTDADKACQTRGEDMRAVSASTPHNPEDDIPFKDSHQKNSHFKMGGSMHLGEDVGADVTVPVKKLPVNLKANVAADSSVQGEFTKTESESFSTEGIIHCAPKYKD